MSEIRPATREDEPAITELVKSSRLPLDGLTDALRCAVVARDGPRVVGCAALEVHGDSGLLRSVAVAADRRGEGLGQDLTRAALDLARARGLRRVYLLTETAERFFPRFGFRRITRDEVRGAVRESVEFRTACPASAAVMVLET
jgi:amino-acid N-acetyltransferase